MSATKIPHTVLETVGAYRDLLEERFGPRLLSLRLFGSFARGDADAHSDVDVAVVIDALTEKERTDAIDLAYAARKAEPMAPPLSPLVWSSAEFEDRLRAERRIAREILSEGISL